MIAVFKRDFVAYFTSAIGYIYIGAYIFVLNLMFYFNNMLSSSSSVSGIFSFMLLMLMFVTPILTMRVFSEDFKLKTDQLLFTSPVRFSAIVLGKFLSSLAVFMILLALTLVWPLVISEFGENNVGEVLGNYLGIFCIGAAYISMGIFISALTENQVVAAVGSLCLFVALYIFEMLAISFYTSGALPGFVMRTLLFISIFGRYGDITRGLLSLDVIVFFLSVCAVFIFLTIRVLEKRRMR